MTKIKNMIVNLSNFKKAIFIFIFIILIAFIAVNNRYSTIARYKDRDSSAEIVLWDGSTASSYHSGDGTSTNPYMITNGAELKYFYEQLLTEDYENEYFVLGNDIMLNKGLFSYDFDNSKIKYTIDTNEYILDSSNGKYYDGETEIGTANIFNPLNNFKGNFDGGMYTIFGLLISGTGNQALFSNLEGTVKNLYVENAMVYGSGLTAGIASSTSGATVKNVSFEGYVIGGSETSSITGGIAAVANNTTFENIANKSTTYGYTVGGIVGNLTGVSSINQSYNVGQVKGIDKSGGTIGIINSNSTVTIGKTYNDSIVSSNNTFGDLVAEVNGSDLTINNSFAKSYNLIGLANSSTITVSNLYSIDGMLLITSSTDTTVTGELTITTESNLKLESFLANTINFNAFVSFNDIETNSGNVWIFADDKYPVLFMEDYLSDTYIMTSLNIGRGLPGYTDETNNITNKSTIRVNYSYTNFPIENLNLYKHTVVSSIELPANTKMILIDNINKKEYEYITTNSGTSFDFELFKETGTDDKFYTDQTYYNNGQIKENFTFILDLSETEISSNYQNASLVIELRDSDENIIRSTLESTIKKVNIYSTINEESSAAYLYLTTDYDAHEILYNKDSTTEVNISSGLYYKYDNGVKIVDTSYENKRSGLLIKFVDGEGNTLDRKYMKNLMFMIGDSIYYPGLDNIIRINLSDSITDTMSVLKVVTYESNNDLKDGTYYLKISNYTSEDGLYYDELGTQEISIPVKVDNQKNAKYSFDVIMNNDDRVIEKSVDVASISFKILQNTVAENPNVRISLYKKNYLTAYDQTYSIVDLEDYTSDNLDKSSNNVYYAVKNPVQYDNNYRINDYVLNLNTSSFDNMGYKIVFDLYDGDKRVGSIEKYFIVKAEGV